MASRRVRNIADISVVASPTFSSKATAFSTISTRNCGSSRRSRMAADAPLKAPPRMTASYRFSVLDMLGFAPLMESLRDAFHFLTDVRGLVQAGGYIALAIIVFTETGLMIGFFLPGDSLLVTAGLFAAKGDLDIVFLNLLLMACAVLGDATGYYIGKRLGPALFRKEDSLLFKKKHLVATH